MKQRWACGQKCKLNQPGGLGNFLIKKRMPRLREREKNMKRDSLSTDTVSTVVDGPRRKAIRVGSNVITCLLIKFHSKLQPNQPSNQWDPLKSFFGQCLGTQEELKNKFNCQLEGVPMKLPKYWHIYVSLKLQSEGQ